VVPEGLNELIADPEAVPMLRSVAYCDYRANELNGIFQKNVQEGVRMDPKLRELNRTLMKQKATIEQGCVQGAITPQEYSEMLKDMLAKDQQLAKYFNSVKDQPGMAAKMKVCMTRFKVVKVELGDLESQM
jgi:phage gp16-like protein